MNAAPDGGPAFLGLHPSRDCRYADSGMSLRDYFAAAALPALWNEEIAVKTYAGHIQDGILYREIAEAAYSAADAMLAARQTTPPRERHESDDELAGITADDRRAARGRAEDELDATGATRGK